MNRTSGRLFGIGALGFSIAGILIALFQIRADFSTYLSSYGLIFLTWRGFSLFDFSLAISLILSVASSISMLMAALLFAKPYLLTLNNDAECRTATPLDLLHIDRISTVEFGNRSSDIDDIRSIYSYCPQSFYVVDLHGIVGYFILYSLTKAGERAALANQFYARNPPRAHIHRLITSGDALFIGAVVGNGFKGKAATHAGFSAVLTGLRQRIIYGKAITDSGVRLAKRYGAKRIDGGNGYVPEKTYLYEKAAQ